MNKCTTTRCLVSLVAGMLVGGSAMAQLPVPDFLKNALPKSAPPPTPSASPTAPTAPLPTAAQLLPPSGGASSSDAADPQAAGDLPQMPANASQLFHQKSATGEELLFVLEALNNAARHRNSRNFLLRASPVTPNTSSGIMQSLAEQGWTTLMSSYSNLAENKSYSDKGLHHFLDTVLQNKEGLKSHRVDLPAQGETLTSTQQERLLILGAMVVGTRIANETLKQAHETFQIISTQYEQLLDHRQKAAALLAGVMDRRRQALAAKNELEARKISNGLSDDDLKFIDSFGSQVTVETFSQDVGLQNLALSYLRKTDPAGYADYVAQTKQFVSSSKAYLQTIGGVSAFGGFSALVVKQLLDMAHAKDYTGGMAALTLIRDFAKEAQPLIKNSGDALYDGLVTAPKNARRMYRIEHAGTLTDADHAPQVFQALASAGDKHYLDDAIFRDGTPGFVSHVYQCDAEHAGDLIDTAVPMAQRKQFAQSYLNWNMDGGFSFADALYDDSGSPSSKHLAEPLLNRDQRKRADAVAIGEIQVQTVTKDDSWNDIQLMRMILANSEGTRAQMQLGGSIVRLVPSMATIYAYESYTDTCIRTAGADSDGHDTKKLASEHKTAKQH
jgi:hypothetical protein